MALAGAWIRERVHPPLLIEIVAVLKTDAVLFRASLHARMGPAA